MAFSWDTVTTPPRGVRSRSINAENPTGEPGAAAWAESTLGPGRKGRAYRPLPAGGRLVLADIEGPAVIRHIWITVPDATEGGPFVLRDLVLRAYWDGSEDPAIEVPLGDFFCNGFATRALVTSAPIVVAPTGGMNSYFAMPFRERATIVIDSEHPSEISSVFYQVDYTVGEEVSADTGYLHAQWRRTNGTAPLGEDHVIVDGIRGVGSYVGTYIALTALERFWWGEGEVKFYVDSDEDLPSQCSTGLEDYAGGAWAFQDHLASDPPPVPIPFSAPYFGYPFVSAVDTTAASPFVVHMPSSHGMYRWHLPDPVLFGESLRVTLQQIGAWHHGLFERSDDIATTAYWYQTSPAEPYPPLPSAAARRPR
jgi:hypothetical protein